MAKNTSTFNVKAFLDSAGLSKKVVEYGRSDLIFAQGGQCDSVFYLQKGGVKLSVLSKTGREAVVAMLGPGSTVSEGARQLKRDWTKIVRWGMPAPAEPAVDLPPDTEGDGPYQLLFKYLHDRFANRIVLTFAEIEDLLGFALPAAARLEADWWTGKDRSAHRSDQADAWIRARRTATVNLPARIVLFERE
jgi:hypothetical protein